MGPSMDTTTGRYTKRACLTIQIAKIIPLITLYCLWGMVPTHRVEKTTGRSRTHGAHNGAKKDTFELRVVKIRATSHRTPNIPQALTPFFITTETPRRAACMTKQPPSPV